MNNVSKLFRNFILHILPLDGKVQSGLSLSMAKMDRRAQRTRELLQKALIELISERGYDAITIQDIVDRANLGRTTFYLHYNSKDELFMSCHEAIIR